MSSSPVSSSGHFVHNFVVWTLRRRFRRLDTSWTILSSGHIVVVRVIAWTHCSSGHFVDNFVVWTLRRRFRRLDTYRRQFRRLDTSSTISSSGHFMDNFVVWTLHQQCCRRLDTSSSFVSSHVHIVRLDTSSAILSSGHFIVDFVVWTLIIDNFVVWTLHRQFCRLDTSSRSFHRMDALFVCTLYRSPIHRLDTSSSSDSSSGHIMYLSGQIYCIVLHLIIYPVRLQFCRLGRYHSPPLSSYSDTLFVWTLNRPPFNYLTT